MANDCDNPNCGWKLYDVKIDTNALQVTQGKTVTNKEAEDKDRPTGKESVAKFEAIRDHYNDSIKLTMPFKKGQCVPCECEPIGDPIWEKDYDKDYELSYTVNGWTVTCPAEVKQGKQLGVCKTKKGKDGKKQLDPI